MISGLARFGNRWQQGSTQAVLAWLLVAVVVLAGIGFIAWQFVSMPDETEAGSIQLSNLTLDAEGARLTLQVDARVRLSPTVQSGLDSGVPLTFVLQLAIVQPRRWWLDEKLLEFERHYTLTFYDLTRHYRVSAVETDVSRSFRSLSSALAGLGEMVNISVGLDSAQAAELNHDGLLASVSMRLSKSALPLPLQPIIRSSWTLVSEEHRWPIT